MRRFDDEYKGPSIERIANQFPGQIVIQGGQPPWVWVRGREWRNRPRELEEASDAYYAAGGTFPGPVQWHEDLLRVKRGTARPFNPFTTLHVPVDLFASIEDQFGELQAVCEAVKRKLIEVCGVSPPRKGRIRSAQLARNILLVVLRDWKRESVASLARRFDQTAAADGRRRVTKRLDETRRLLARSVPEFERLRQTGR